MMRKYMHANAFGALAELSKDGPQASRVRLAWKQFSVDMSYPNFKTSASIRLRYSEACATMRGEDVNQQCQAIQALIVEVMGDYGISVQDEREVC